PNETKRRGQNRARFDEAGAARALDRLESLAHLARTSTLFCAQTRLQSVRSFPVMPERQNFSANRRSAKAHRNNCVTLAVSAVGCVRPSRRDHHASSRQL